METEQPAGRVVPRRKQFGSFSVGWVLTHAHQHAWTEVHPTASHSPRTLCDTVVPRPSIHQPPCNQQSTWQHIRNTIPRDPPCPPFLRGGEKTWLRHGQSDEAAP